jgi:hypothetical protein
MGAPNSTCTFCSGPMVLGAYRVLEHGEMAHLQCRACRHLDAKSEHGGAAGNQLESQSERGGGGRSSGWRSTDPEVEGHPDRDQEQARECPAATERPLPSGASRHLTFSTAWDGVLAAWSTLAARSGPDRSPPV